MGIIPFQMNMFDNQPARTMIKKPLSGFWNRKNLIKKIGAINAAIGKIHLPLKKKRKIKPIKK